MTKGQLPVVVGVIVAVVVVIVIIISLVIYVGAVITLKIFGAGGVEVVNTFNTPYLVANLIAKQHVDGRPLLEPLLEASISNDASTISKISAKIQELLGGHDFPYIVQLDSIVQPTAECTQIFIPDHKAVDISANCGTPVKALCSGRLEIASGLSDDPVFIGEKVVIINHDDKCDLRGYRTLYGCINIPDRKGGDVTKGKVIGYVGTCSAEKDAGCHLHLRLTKGTVRDAEDPKICSNIDAVLQLGTNVLARKGDIEDVEATATIPLMYKNHITKLMVTVGEG